ncbi:MAG: hypothetical protein WC821_02730 [archaeon]|jgi:hypothetical protein
MDGSAAFGGIKSFSQQATLEPWAQGKGLSRERQSPKKKFNKSGGGEDFLEISNQRIKALVKTKFGLLGNV